jgi:hypothetical protein
MCTAEMIVLVLYGWAGVLVPCLFSDWLGLSWQLQ